MKRRDFIKVTGAAAAGFALAGCMPKIGSWSKQDEKLYGPKKTGHFSLMQISSATDTIGNSYLLRTSGGKVIMMDGGFATDAPKLRGKLAEILDLPRTISQTDLRKAVGILLTREELAELVSRLTSQENCDTIPQPNENTPT